MHKIDIKQFAFDIKLFEFFVLLELPFYLFINLRHIYK